MEFLFEQKELNQLSESVQNILQNWLKDRTILHFWNEDDTILVCTYYKEMNKMQFLRVFCIGINWYVSIDQEVNL